LPRGAPKHPPEVAGGGAAGTARRPQISIAAVTTEADVAAQVRSLYLAAMRKAGEANGVGKTIDGGNSINGRTGDASD
jgi:hypothetical protein